MKVGNLEVGMVAKNYKDLCRVLEIEYKNSGKSRQIQLEEIKRFIDFEKVNGTNKIKIKDIYDKPSQKIDGRTQGNAVNSYINDGELLLIDLLLCSKRGEIALPTSSLLLALNMVNKNYNKYFGDKRYVLANGLNIEIEYVHDYLDTVNSSLNGSIKTIINRLEKRNLIDYTKITMVKEMIADTEYIRSGKIKIQKKIYYDENGVEVEKFNIPQAPVKGIYREASVDEIRQIVTIRREEFLKLGFEETDSENKLYAKGLMHKFNKIVQERVFDELNLSRVYKAHRIIYNIEHLQNEKSVILDKIKRKLIQDGVNKEVIDTIMKNANNRVIKAFDKLNNSIDFGEIQGKFSNKDMLRLTDDRYLEYYDILNQFLIDSDLSKEKEEEMFRPIFNKNIKVELPNNMQ